MIFCTAVAQVAAVISLNAPSSARLSHSEDRGWSHLPAHTAMNGIKPPELNERKGMQGSTAGEVHINPRQMCITGSYSYYSCSTNIRSLKAIGRVPEMTKWDWFT